MKAAIYEEYGGPEVVRLGEVAKPTPAAAEVLIRVRATTVSSGDWRMRSREVPKGFGVIAPFIFGRRPKQRILGTELAGVIEAVGAGVTKWQVGDEVFAFPGAKMGAHAEYVVVSENGCIAPKPSNLSYEEAAALSFGGSTALSFIEKGGGIRQGEKVLVVGASGAVGSAMVQLAKHYSANVTGVCSGDNAELVRSLGADHVIDYAKEDFASRGRVYDIIVDTVGTAPIARAKECLAPGGRLLMVFASFGDMLRSVMSKHIVAGPASEDPKYMSVLAELGETGKFKALIDTIYPFEEIVEAHRRVDSHHKRGSVIVRVE
jgi:NADPH:quinone reductase-like Zn-dependent oxidoreductase